MRLLIATTNHGKAREFRRLLADFEFEVDDLSAYPSLPAVEETGHTFGANACLKASYYAKGLETWTLADDSGLAVDALEGSPGVHSARWAEMHRAGRGDADNNSLLLRQLELVTDERRTARFVCVLALADPRGRVIMTACDWVLGRVLRAARGDGGFGYDPLFFLDSHGQTTGELAPEEKNELSHRGKALRRMCGLVGRHPIAQAAP
jgi:XTP/dITP diphosphohydrolase